MKKLHTFHLWERPQAGLYKDLLLQEGVVCLLKNDQLSSAVGEIPFIECFPELWVIDDEIYPRARLLLDAWLETPVGSTESWICGHCGEESGGQFTVCWSCGKAHEEQGEQTWASGK
ncbi:MAG: hypothetical protein BA864_14540 [Desulfuromonadales bacterium C00003093]|nr:MAG: hypothetical protein BA864_14540 [Desulfuromonadales bacterium C00003093]